MPGDWTTGAAKWAAVFCLGAASAAGLGWSIFGRSAAAPITITRAPAPPPAPSQPAASQPIMPDPPSPAVLAAPTESAEAPAAEREPAAKQPPAPAPVLTRTINVNTASASELELLPGIGPALAAEIIAHRQRIGSFRSIEQLDDVKGIGPKKLEKLRPLVRVN